VAAIAAASARSPTQRLDAGSSRRLGSVTRDSSNRSGDSVAESYSFNPKSWRYFFLPLRCIFSAVVTIVLRLVDGMLERRAVGVRIDEIGC